jgi:predicted P-loop ATPase
MKIAYGNSRFTKKWVNKRTSFEEFCARLETPRRTTETVSEYKKFAKSRRDDAKDVGGYVFGHLKGGRRKKDAIESRSAITLDADHADRGFLDRVEMLSAYKCVIYSTHSHTPEEPRLRMVIPLSREVSPDEYGALSRLIAEEIGMDYFDDSTYEPHRLMYWPSTPSDGEYIFKRIDGAEVDPDSYLRKLSDWRDCSLWPTSSRQSEVLERNLKKQQDPLEKEGILGAFCRAYSIEDVIEQLLSDIYEPSAVDGRYDYTPGESSAGVVTYDGKFAYSHHATDPACGKLLNAFDLVRVHKYGDLDEKAGFKAMAELASSDPKVKRLIARERKEAARAEFDDEDWTEHLKYTKGGEFLQNSVWNLMLILNNDPDFAGFAYNELAGSVEVIGEVPWERPLDNLFWRDADTAQLKALIDIKYLAFSSRNHEVAFTKVADDRRFHPIKDYLAALPAWDGVERIDTLLVYYLGAEDTPYVRAVTRKTFLAAVARIFKPGTKFDSILVLNGPQGIGKSTLFARLGGEWYSDSLSISDMKDKTAAEKLQGYWILEMGELAGIKKMDVETVKSFITRVDDKYRPSYGRTVESHPRQCVIVGSTNSDGGFLRDITGNRRFWPVRVTGNSSLKPWDLDNVDQLWAEALAGYKKGEELFLTGELAEEANAQQREAMESDDREGLVTGYLETLLPADWDEMDLYQRRNFLSGSEFGGETRVGTVRREQVCNLEIWCECFGKPRETIKKADSYEIESILNRIGGWEKFADNKSGKKLLPMYGIQRVYIRSK